MNAANLLLPDGTPSKVWFCGQCRTVSDSQHSAERCCAPELCERCHSPRPKHYLLCDACRVAKDRARETECFVAAEKVTEWDGWIYCENVQGHNNGFYDSVESLQDYIAGETPGPEELAALTPEERADIPAMPAYVWTCTAIPFVKIDLRLVTDHIGDEAYDDFDVQDLCGLAELQVAIDAFNKANVHHVKYEPNFKTALLIEP